MRNWLLLLWVVLGGLHISALELSIIKSIALQIPEDYSFGHGYAAELYYFLIDAKLGKILIFDQNGRFLNTFDQKGVGPGEMLAPIALHYKDGRAAVVDVMRQGIHVFSFKEGQFSNPDFIPVGFRPRDVIQISNQLVVIGYNSASETPAWASILSWQIKQPKAKPLISREEMLGISAEEDRKTTVNKISLAAAELVTTNDSSIFTCWGGNMRLLAYDLDTRKKWVFGCQGLYYQVPKSNKALERLYSSQSQGDLDKYHQERKKLCLVNSLAATKNYLYVTFQTPLVVKGEFSTVIQKYRHDGTFMGEFVLSALFKRQDLEEQGFKLQALVNHQDDQLLIMEYSERNDNSVQRLVHHVAIK